jgi:hypothetical protein
MTGERRRSGIASDAPPSSEGRNHALGLEDEPPPTEAELAEAEALREALDRGEAPLAVALRAVFVPARLDDDAHAEMLARALGEASASKDDERSAPEVDAPSTPAEQDAAARLREALDAPRREARHDEPLAELAHAMRAAYRPRDIEPLRNEALVARALGRAASQRKARRVVPIVSAAVLGVAAMAASVALVFSSRMPTPSSTTAAMVAPYRSRSAADLFDPTTPFPREGGESARVDRIASARAGDLRANRFASWGVR